MARTNAASTSTGASTWLIGGGVGVGNIGRALAATSGVIVSRSLMQPPGGHGVQWDSARVRALLADATAATSEQGAA